MSRSEVRRAVDDVWRELLGVDELDDDDDFFFLGGHSLMAIEVIDALEGRVGVAVPVSTFFEQPTPAGLTEYIESQRS
jgi:acyl carrier protein